jgi:methionyl-tRNA formyltransferase
MRIVFLGTPAFAVPTLDALDGAGHDIAAVVCQPDRPAGRGQALREPATKVWAREHQVLSLQPEKVRDGRLAAALQPLRPEVLVVVAYGRILGSDLLTLAPRGAVNVHASLLPKYRGAAPIQWALAKGERETGVTVMQMDEGLDTGDVLLQRALHIRPDDTAETLSLHLARLGGDTLVECLRLIEQGRAVRLPQDGSRATMAPILKKEDGRIDWSRPAMEVLARLRAFTPWPGAWTTLGEKTLKILEAAAQEHSARPGASTAAPGSASRIAGQGLAVACGGSSILLVTRLQPEGKPPLDALSFLNGLRRDQVAFGT